MRQGTDGYLEVLTTTHPVAGPQQSSVFVNVEGVIANCPQFGEQYVGRRDCLWLPPALRSSGASGWVGMYPSQLQVVELTAYRGVPVWRCEYKVFGNTCSIYYDQTSGVKIAQDGVGYLAKSTLGLPLPR